MTDATDPAGDMLIRGSVIEAVGQHLSVDDPTVVDAMGCVVLPGFIDTHWHLWNTIARGLASRSRGGFMPTMAAIAPLFGPEDSACGVRLGLAEAVNGGNATVQNWAHSIAAPAHADAELAVMRASGVRGRFAYGYPQSIARDKCMDFSHLREMAGAAGGSR